MISWCSYCQRYIGETPPFNDYSITHGLCKACFALIKNDQLDDHNIESAKKIAQFYNNLRSAALSGSKISVHDVITFGKSFGLKDIDICVGMLQPILYEIGEMWKQGTVSVSKEHQFTAFSESIISSLQRLSDPGPRAEQDSDKVKTIVDVLLVCAEGNYHTVGIKIIDLAMKELGLSTMVFTPGIPLNEVLALARQHKPKILGISLSLTEQIPTALDIASNLSSDVNTAKISVIVGGRGVREEGKQFAAFPMVLVAPTDISSLKGMVLGEILRQQEQQA